MGFISSGVLLSCVLLLVILPHIASKPTSLGPGFDSPYNRNSEQYIWNQIAQPSKRENELDGWQAFSKDVSSAALYPNDQAGGGGYLDGNGSRSAPPDDRRYRKKVFQPSHHPSRRTMLCALLKYVVQMRQMKKKTFDW